jgi:tripartite-type tricarboxylate transporter receptor subunit TctC
MAGRIGRNMMNGFCRALGGIALALLASSSTARAQTYPDRPVKIIVPIGPGGSYDLVGRHLADVLSRRTGQAFVVENKPGAGTVVGTQAASQSEPDGYTLMIGGLSNMAFNSALYSKLGYDPLKDFVPVALVWSAAKICRKRSCRTSSRRPKPIRAPFRLRPPASAPVSSWSRLPS